MQSAVFFKTLDRGNVGAVLHHGKCQAGISPSSIDQYRTRPALAVVAALFCAGEVEMCAQRIEQGRPWRDAKLGLSSVDDQLDRDFIWRRNGYLGRRTHSRHVHPRISKKYG